MNTQSDPPASPTDVLQNLLAQIEMVRYERRKMRATMNTQKLFTQEELTLQVFPSYRNLIVGRSRRIPSRGELIRICEYLECTPEETDAILICARYLPLQEKIRHQKRHLVFLAVHYRPLTMTPGLVDDPEFFAERLETALTTSQQIVQEFGGLLNSHVGSLSIAVWGAFQTLEEHVEQALWAALSIQKHITDISATIGISIGKVYVSTGKKGAQLHIIGAALDEAITLSHLDDASLHITQPVYRRLRHLIKSHASNAGIYSVEAIHEDRLRLVQNASAPRLIGRSTEMALLEQMHHQLTTVDQSQFLLLLGEPGIGKTRMVGDFLGRLKTQSLQVAITHASAATQQTPYAAFRRLFTSLVMQDQAVPIEEKVMTRVLAQAWSSSLEGERRAQLIMRLLGLSRIDEGPLRGNAYQFRERAISHLIEYLTFRGQSYPLVLLFEDIHWIDTASLELLLLVKRKVQSGLLILATSRETFFDQHPQTERQIPTHQRLWLKPLNEAQMVRLIDEIASQNVFFAAYPRNRLQETVIERAGGNPLFAEELLDTLASDGELSELPQTLEMIFAARFESLSPLAQQFLSFASVAIEQMTDALLEAFRVEYETNAEEMQHAVEELMRRNIIRTHQHHHSTGQETITYHFYHVLFQNAVFQRLLLNERRHYHIFIAQWLETHTAREHFEQLAPVIAAHYDQGQQVEKAGYWYLQAGQFARQRYAQVEALYFYERAYTLLPSNDYPKRFSILIDLEAIHNARGNREAQQVILAELTDLAAILADREKQIEVLSRQSQLAEASGEYERAMQLALEVTEEGRRWRLPYWVTQGELQQAKVLLGQHRIQELAAFLNTMPVPASDAASSDLSLEYYRLKAVVSIRLSDYTSAKQFNEKAMNLATVSGKRDEQLSVLSLAAGLAATMHEYEKAKALYMQQLTLAEELQLLRPYAIALFNLGSNELRQWHFVEAAEAMRSSLSTFYQMHDWGSIARVRASIGFALMCLGDYDEAEGELTEALELNRSVGNWALVSNQYAFLSLIANYQNDLEKALILANHAVDTAHDSNHSLTLAYATTVAGHAQFNLGQVSAAHQTYANALGHFKKQGEGDLWFEALAGDMMCALSQGDHLRIEQALQPIVPVLLTRPPLYLREPLRIYTMAYKGLAFLSDQRMHDILEAGWQMLQKQVKHIQVPYWEKRYLETIPYHRELVSLYRNAP